MAAIGGMRVHVVVLAAVLAAGLLAPTAQAELREGTVYLRGSSFEFVSGVQDPKGAAFGSHSPAADHISNFGVLKIETSDHFSDSEQMFAAGVLEGQLTQPEIHNMYINMMATYDGALEPPPHNLTAFLSKQDAWMRDMVTKNPQEPFWRQVHLITQQFDGLHFGYNKAAPKDAQLAVFAFQMLNGVGDFFDLLPATMPGLRADFEKMSAQEVREYVSAHSHCSAIVKLSGDFSDLLMSHASWFTYQAMTRIMKHYYFKTADAASKKVSFSSYPGFLESLDDFYLMDAGLVMLQTTNSIFNHSLYEYVVPETIQAWVRVRVASSLARTAEEWSGLMSRYNSGTYNNQYMVVDLNKFTPKEPLVPGTLFVSEQIPGHFLYTDQTEVLERGYWASYNVASNPEIYRLSGYPEMVKRYGTDYSYDLAPRAKIFRRNQTSVTDLESLKALMRSNQYTTDPYAEGSPDNAICARGDLTGGKHTMPSAGGCYDAKVTSYALALQLQSEAINGPTTVRGELPAFTWHQFPNKSSAGMPDVFDFHFEAQDPAWDN